MSNTDSTADLMWLWHKFSLSDGFEKYCGPSFPDLADDDNGNYNYMRRCGYLPLGEDLGEVYVTTQVEFYHNYYNYTDLKLPTYAAIISNGDVSIYVCMESLNDCHELRRRFTEIINNEKVIAFLGYAQQVLRKWFHKVHEHEVEEACMDCDPEQVRRERLSRERSMELKKKLQEEKPAVNPAPKT